MAGGATAGGSINEKASLEFAPLDASRWITSPQAVQSLHCVRCRAAIEAAEVLRCTVDNVMAILKSWPKMISLAETAVDVAEVVVEMVVDEDMSVQNLLWLA